VLKVVFQDLDLTPTLHALCAGFESGRWRQEQLVTGLFDWLPDFALTYSERQSFTSETGVRQLRRAAHAVYGTDKFQRRGEFGELLLHVVLRETFETEPAITKIYYKDGPNDTVKGFDAVHAAVDDDGELELWLGEVKFYSSLKRALTDIAKELVTHFGEGYLRSEFGAVVNKLDPAWPMRDELAALLDPNTSLDEIVPRVRVPALVTFDSSSVGAHASHCPEYLTALEQEVRQGWDHLITKSLPAEVVIHVLMVPLEDKKEFVSALHEKLKAWQTIL
jgi:hypothetical protein